MKRKLFCGLMLISMGTMLTGCHMSHEWADATCTEPRTCTVGGETEGEALGHQWVDATCEEAKHCSKCGETEGAALGHTLMDATYKEAAVCTVCGKTEGEPKKSYFEEHGAEVADAPVSCTMDALIFNFDNPEEYQMTTDGTYEQIDCYSEPSDEEGYQLIHLELCASSQLYYDAAQNIDYNSIRFSCFICDWYTGRALPARDMSDNDAFSLSSTLDIDGVSYDVSYTDEVQGEFGGWIVDDNGDETESVKQYHTYTFKVPDGYDGLVFGAVPINEYRELDTETVYGTGIEDEEDVVYVFDEDVYVDGMKFFRINKEGTVPERVAEDTATAE